jgi:hypothetical protein
MARRFMACEAVLFALACLLAGVSSAQSSHGAGPTSADSSSVYAPYTFLIGEWDVRTGAAEPTAVARFSWGGGRSYILFATSLLLRGREEPHFEGMLMWNGVSRQLDMLLALDLKDGRVQEQGRMYVQTDGVVVREITAYYGEGARAPDGRVVDAKGATAKFRQTFKPLASGSIETSLMRETPHGWTPTFPGSNKAVMTRRPDASVAH